MRKGSVVEVAPGCDNMVLIPGMAAGTRVTVTRAMWCDYHNEGCIEFVWDGKKRHAPDCLFNAVKKERKPKTVECGWCNSAVVPAADGTCPRCECSAVTPPWRS